MCQPSIQAGQRTRLYFCTTVALHALTCSALNQADTYHSQGHRPGEVAEWKSELADKHKQKDALKKIIAAMTIGKDVSAVFAEVTSCSQTSDLELKKLVYLYLINYAKTQPELAILAVNTFVKVLAAATSGLFLSDIVVRTGDNVAFRSTMQCNVKYALLEQVSFVMRIRLDRGRDCAGQQ